jgi:hypothetical protein
MKTALNSFFVILGILGSGLSAFAGSTICQINVKELAPVRAELLVNEKIVEVKQFIAPHANERLMNTSTWDDDTKTKLFAVFNDTGVTSTELSDATGRPTPFEFSSLRWGKITGSLELQGPNPVRLIWHIKGNKFDQTIMLEEKHALAAGTKVRGALQRDLYLSDDPVHEFNHKGQSLRINVGLATTIRLNCLDPF